MWIHSISSLLKATCLSRNCRQTYVLRCLKRLLKGLRNYGLLKQNEVISECKWITMRKVLLGVCKDALLIQVVLIQLVHQPVLHQPICKPVSLVNQEKFMHSNVNGSLEQYVTLFENVLSCYRGASVQLTVNKGPQFHKARPVPYAIRDSVKKELNKMVDDSECYVNDLTMPW